MNFAAMNHGATELVRSLIDCTWPEYFFTKLLGLSRETIDKLPALALWVVGAYLVFALAALGLKKWKGLKSFSDLARKIGDTICLVVGVMCLWIVPQFIAQGKVLAAQQVVGSYATRGYAWVSDMAQAWFDPVFLIILLVAMAVSPVLTMWRYVKTYKGWGLVWAVYDACFGVVLMAAAVLAMHHGSFLWYLTVVPPVILVALGQRGGVEKDVDPERGK